MAYSNITGIGRIPVNRIENITLAQYDGEAKPGELVVDLTTNNLYVAANTGNLSVVGGGGGGGTPAGVSKDIQFNTAGAFAANSTFQFDDTTGTLTVNQIAANTITMTGDILPSSDNAYSLGSNAMQWKELWVSGNTIYLDGTALSVQSNSSIAFGGNTLLTTDESGGMNVTQVSVAGNVEAQYFVGNGSQLTGISGGGSSYGNANLANIGSNAIGTTGPATLGTLTVGDTIVGTLDDPVGISDYSGNGTVLAFNYDGLMSPEPINDGQTCIVSDTGVAGLDGTYTVINGYSYGFTVSSSFVGTGSFGGPLPPARAVLASDVNITGNISVTGVTSLTGRVFIDNSQGSGGTMEGGEIQLARAANSNINTGISIDVYQNKLRFFENGGNARGAYIDISAMAPAVGTNIFSPPSTLNVTTSNVASLVLTTADSGKYIVFGPATTSLTLPTGAPVGTYFELASQKSGIVAFFPPGSENIQFANGGFGPSNFDQFIINAYGTARLVKATATDWILTGFNVSIAA